MVRESIVIGIGLVALVTGCQTVPAPRDPEYAQLVRATHQAVHHASTSTSQAIVCPGAPELEGPRSVEEFIQVALRQNPDVQAARKNMEALAHQVPVAASLQDPTLNLTVQPAPVDTAAGQQDLILSASQKVPWLAKLDVQAEVAEAHTNVARARLAATELDIITKVRRAYYELYFIQQAIAITKEEQKLLSEIRDVAENRYRTGETSQQDVLRAELEISQLENELIRLQQELESGQARLARLLHVAPQTRLRAWDELPPEDVPGNLESLQEAAVRARPELHAKLAEIEGNHLAVELAHLDYKPDLTWGFSWIDVASAGLSPVANGRDSFLLTVGSNVPLYRKRLNSSVRSAEAKAVSSAREYDSLRDATLEEVTDLFAQVRSQQEMLRLFREDILPKARQTLEVSSLAYNVGQVDFLQLIDNWRQLLRYEITRRRLDATLRQTLADVERMVGGVIASDAEGQATTVATPEVLPPPSQKKDEGA